MDSPSIIPDIGALETWLTRQEAAARSTSDGETLARIADLRAILDDAADYRDLCASNAENARSETKKLRTQARYAEMRAKFRSRIIRRDMYGGHRTDQEIRMEIARDYGIRSPAGAYKAIPPDAAK